MDHAEGMERAHRATLMLVRIIAEAIEDAGTDGIPSGYVYAAVMSVVNLHQYRALINELKRLGEVREDGHRLFWIGKPLQRIPQA